MGRAYMKDLGSLEQSILWANQANIDDLSNFVNAAAMRPLIAVGSGGSATAAHLAALLHRFETQSFGRHSTPLDSLLGEPNLNNAAILLLSASGKNKDVLAALKYGIHCDARAIATLCTRRGSPLARTARKFERAYIFEEDIPCGKDGFLATNSLIASCILLARAYSVQLPEHFTLQKEIESISEDVIEGKSTAVILHGGWSSPVATDLESKLNESAILSALVSDYRNFGHGRHFGLHRRANESIVLKLVTPETASLAQKTTALLPENIPVVELESTFHGAGATIDLLLQVLFLVGKLGQLQDFDPGRPAVPDFGRKLYHLSPTLPSSDVSLPVTRKVSCSTLNPSDRQSNVELALEQFSKRLSEANLGGIVMDYDGTLCGQKERFGVPQKKITNHLIRLINEGLVLGIATGRGRSVRQALQKVLPQSLWEQVVIGYYNGGNIASLTRDDVPSREAPPKPPLDVALDLILNDHFLQQSANITARSCQITVEPPKKIPSDALMSYVMTVLAPLELTGVRVLTSSHSIDILPPGVGKLSVVDEVLKLISPDRDVLCIGDRGAWPGNDCSLLSHELSLSVDEVSTSLTSCWNLAPPGSTGVGATIHYLDSICTTNGDSKFILRNLRRKW